MEANLITTFGEGVLVNPRGIYVTPEHICYVADRDAKAVFVFDADGELIHTYGKPTAPLYGETQDFLPLKVIANEAGTMYIICESNTNGIVQISPVDGGTFLGYFGTNGTDPSLWNIILDIPHLRGNEHIIMVSDRNCCRYFLVSVRFYHVDAGDIEAL